MQHEFMKDYFVEKDEMSSTSDQDDNVDSVHSTHSDDIADLGHDTVVKRKKSEP